MRMLRGLLFVIAAAAAPLSLPALAAGAGEPAPPAPGACATPGECLKALGEYRDTLGRASHDIASGYGDYERMVTSKVLAQAKVYAAQFKAAQLHGAAVLDFAFLQAQARNWAQARAALDQRLAEPDMTAAERAKTLSAAISGFSSAQPSSSGEEAHKLIDDSMARLDALGDAVPLHERIAAYDVLIRMDGARGDGASLQQHCAAYLRLFSQMPVEQRDHEYFGLYRSYTTLADYFAARGDYARAADVLAGGVEQFKQLKDEPKSASELGFITYDLGRYRQVNTPAKPIEAPHWLNGPPAGGRLDVKGKVTLLEFTSHWCIPCRETYPVMVELNRKYADKGLQVAFVTELYGWYGKKRNIPAEEELADDAEYFPRKHGISFPVAISGAPATMGRSPNFGNYYAQGIPQIVLIDRDGIIRTVKVGLEKNEAAGLEAEVEKLLE